MKEPNIHKRIKPPVLKEPLTCQQGFRVFGVPDAWFPFKPYPQQVKVVQTVHNAIKNCHNSAIESPTGTGKTLCLLVGALSAAMQVQVAPKIFYVTRTHSQIAQVMEEMAKTRYEWPVTVMGSRQHLCVHPNLTQLKGKELDRCCEDYCRQKLCRFKQFTFKDLPSCSDLSSYRQKCAKMTMCPYYYAKQAAQRPGLILLSYNYVLDWNMLANSGLNFKDAVIIFDEAHSIQNSAEDGSSLTLTPFMLAAAIKDLKGLQKMLNITIPTTIKAREEKEDGLNALTIVFFYLQSLQKVLAARNGTMFTSKAQFIDFLTEATSSSEGDKINAQPLDSKSLPLLLELFQQVNRHFNRAMKGGAPPTFREVSNTLQRISLILKDGWQDYIVRIRNNFSEHNEGSAEDSSKAKKIGNSYFSAKEKQGIILEFRCMTPARAFKRLLVQQPRSLIICSGTLNPLPSYSSLLGIPFHCLLRVPSFITSQQAYTCIVSQSSEGATYDFSFRNRLNQNMYAQLGRELKAIWSATRGGLVIAVPSYEVIERIVRILSPSEINRDLMQGPTQGQIFFQSKQGSFSETLSGYSGRITLSGKAAIIIVMKGKFSEGINFSGELCRCLVVLGVPFLNTRGINVEDKKLWLTDKSTDGSKHSSSDSNSYSSLSYRKANKKDTNNNFDQLKRGSVPDFSSWYLSQAMIAVKQTIGRVIRNPNDYGVILLFDMRYNQNDVKSMLPDWFSRCERTMKPGWMRDVSTFLNDRQNGFSNNEVDSSLVNLVQQTIVPSQQPDKSKTSQILRYQQVRTLKKKDPSKQPSNVTMDYLWGKASEFETPQKPAASGCHKLKLVKDENEDDQVDNAESNTHPERKKRDLLKFVKTQKKPANTLSETIGETVTQKPKRIEMSKTLANQELEMSVLVQPKQFNQNMELISRLFLPENSQCQSEHGKVLDW